MSELTGLAHLGLYTKDIQKSKDFYVNLLGFESMDDKRIDKGGGAYLDISFVRTGSLVIELLQPSDPANIKTGNNGAIDHVAIVVKDIEHMAENLANKGIVFETKEPIFVEKLFNTVKVIFFQGPSGERLELFEYLA